MCERGSVHDFNIKDIRRTESMTLQELFEARTFDLCRNLVHFLGHLEQHNSHLKEDKDRRGKGQFRADAYIEILPDQSGVPAIKKGHVSLLRTLLKAKATIETMLRLHIQFTATEEQITVFTLDPACRKVIFDQLLKCSFGAGARRCPIPCIPCMCSFGAGAGRCSIPRIPCIGSFRAGARRCPIPCIPCICS